MRSISALLVLLYLLISGGTLFAQQKISDTTYVRRFQDIFHFKLISQFRPVLLRVQDEVSHESILYSPNTRPSIGIGGEVVDIGFALVLKMPESFGKDSDIYGNTRFHDFQFNWYQDNFAADFQYQFYEGFYISHINNPDISYDQNMERPDLLLEGYGLNGAFVLNPDNFSYAAAFNNTRKQLRSRGSFLVLASLKHTIARANNGLVPDEFLNEFQTSSFFRDGAFTGFSVMPGYAQTFVAGDFYLNLALAVGPDLQYKEYTLADMEVYEWAVEGKMNFRLGFGYDNGKIFTGLFYLGRRNKYNVGDMNLIHDAGFLRLSLGHRFQETGWMQDVRDWGLYKKVMNPFK